MIFNKAKFLNIIVLCSIQIMDFYTFLLITDLKCPDHRY